MPTGYTSDIENGMQFPEFIRTCARGFGALITMRDEPMNAPFPEKIDADTKYYDGQIVENNARLERISKMSVAELKQEAKKQFEEAVVLYNGYINKAVELKKKYTAILKDVYEWQPPTADHIRLKEFMIEQITTSIDHDCDSDYYKKRLDEIKLLSPTKWRSQQMKSLKESIQYHTKHRQEEIDRAAERTKWIQELITSLPELTK